MWALTMVAGIVYGAYDRVQIRHLLDCWGIFLVNSFGTPKKSENSPEIGFLWDCYCIIRKQVNQSNKWIFILFWFVLFSTKKTCPGSGSLYSTLHSSSGLVAADGNVVDALLCTKREPSRVCFSSERDHDTNLCNASATSFE